MGSLRRDVRSGRLVHQAQGDPLVQRTLYGAGAGGGGGFSGLWPDLDFTGSSLADIVTRTHALLTGLGADDHTQYLLRAGRAGAGNNATISTTAAGLLVGSGVTGFGLGLAAFDGPILGIDDEVRLNPNATTMAPADLATSRFPRLLSFGQDLLFDVSTAPCVFSAYEVGSPKGLGGADRALWSVAGVNGTYPGILAISTIGVRPHVISDGSDQHLVGFWTVGVFEPHLEAAGGNVIVGDIDEGLMTFYATPHYSTSAGGVMTVVKNRCAFNNPTVSAGVTVQNNIGYAHTNTDDGGAIEIDIGFDCPVAGSIIEGSMVHASIRNQDDRRVLQHAGPGVFGTAGEPTTGRTGSVALEVQSATQALLLSRLDSAAVVTPTNGMEVYDTTTDPDRFLDREGGVWKRRMRAGDALAAESVALTGKTADIADTAFTSPVAPGLYRVSYYLNATTSAVAAGAVVLHIKFTDDASAQNLASAPVILTALTSPGQGVMIVKLNASTLTYGTTHTGIFSTAVYALTLTVERLA